MTTEYRMYCPNCTEHLAIMPVKPLLELNCKKCGFYCKLENYTEDDGFEPEYQIQIPLTKEPMETFRKFENEQEIRPLLHCPFCKKKMQYVQKEESYYWCDDCRKIFSPEYF